MPAPAARIAALLHRLTGGRADPLTALQGRLALAQAQLDRSGFDLAGPPPAPPAFPRPSTAASPNTRAAQGARVLTLDYRGIGLSR